MVFHFDGKDGMMVRIKCLPIVALLTSTLWLPAFCKVIYVPDDAQTIQSGIDISADGDTVMVGSDIYFENISFDGKQVVVVSECGPEVTSINGSDNGSVVAFDAGESSGAILDGFTIENGYSNNGSGIYCNGSSPIIRENIIIDNHATSRGGGIFSEYGFPTVDQNIISNNNVSQNGGGGIYVRHGSCMITGNEISHNSVGMHGAGISTFDADLFIIGNLILDNYSPSNGGGIATDEATLEIISNTFYGNAASGNGGGFAITTGSTATVRNNIVVNNWDGGGIYSGGGSTVDISYNDVWNNSGGDYSGLSPGYGDISEDPLFVGGYPFEFYLSDGSPCIDAGDPGDTPPPGGGSRIDMGAFEFLHTLRISPDEFELYMIEGGAELITDSLFLSSYLSEPVSFELSCEAEWVDLEFTTGELGEEETDTVSVDFDGTSLETGLHTTEILAWFHGETIDTTLVVPVSLMKYAVKPVEVELVCEDPSAPRGGFLEFDAIFTNNMDTKVTVDGWLDVIRINGEPYTQNPVLGPAVIILSPLVTITMPIALAVPVNAPLGGNYTMCGFVGYYDEFVIDEDSFEFVVTP